MPDQLNPFVSPQADPEPGYANWATSDPAALRRVKLGLTIIYYSICGLIVNLVAIPIVLTYVGGLGEGGKPSVLLVIGTFWLLMLLGFAGIVLCAAVPQDSGAKGLAQAAVTLQAMFFMRGGCVMVPSLFGVEWMPESLRPVFSIFNSTTGVSSFVCFVLAMRKIALYVARWDVAARTSRTLVMGSLVVVLLIGTSVAEQSREEISTEWSWLQPTLFLAGCIGMLVAMVMYANTVTYLRKAITA